MVIKNISSKDYYLLINDSDGTLFGLHINKDGKIYGGQTDFQKSFDSSFGCKYKVWKPSMIGRWNKILENCNVNTLVYSDVKRTIIFDGKDIEISEESFQAFKRQFMDE